MAVRRVYHRLGASIVSAMIEVSLVNKRAYSQIFSLGFQV